MSLRPLRPAGGAVLHLALPFVAIGLGRSTGSAWLFILATVLGVTVLPAVLLPALGARRARVHFVAPPAVAAAGDGVRIAVAATAPRPIAVTLLDRGAVVARWWQPAGPHEGEVIGTFERRGKVEHLQVRVRCASPLGLWPWEHRSRVDLIAPVLVGPQATPAAVPPPVGLELDEGSATVERRGEAGEVGGVRPWTDGDSVGWIHWPTSLRAGELVVRDWLPPGRPLVEVSARGGTPDPEAEASRAMGQVEAGLAAGYEVRLVLPEAEVRVRRRLDAARALAQADLGRVPDVETPPAPEPDPVEDRIGPRIGAAVTMLIGAVAVLGSLSWPPLTSLVCLVGIPAGAVFSWAVRRHPTRGVMLVTVPLAMVALARFVVGAPGSDDITGLREPLAELLLTLLVVHGFDLPKRRNLRFSVGASTALILYAGVLRVDPTYGFLVVTWFLAAGWTLTALHRSELTEVGSLRGPQRDPTRRERLRRGGRTALVAGACGALSLAVLSQVPIPEGAAPLLYPSQLPVRTPIVNPGALVLPGEEAGGRGGGGGGGGSRGQGATGTIGYFAFAEQFDTSTRGRPDNTVVMRVRAPAPDFWRGQTFDRWDGRTWYASTDKGELDSGPIVSVRNLDGDVPAILPSDELVQTYFIEQPMPNLVFAAYRPARVYIDASVWVRPDGALRADTTLEKHAIYTVVSRRPRVTNELLLQQGGPEAGPLQRLWTSPSMQRQYTRLPDSTSSRVRALALALTASHPAVVDKVRAIEDWLATNTTYDLSAPVPPQGADAVDHFLFESHRGFCEQIASALTVMLRAVGIPARVAAGYTSGHWDPFAGVWVVKASDAHAWTEVWFPATGWQAFDPTASVPLAGDTVERGSLGGPIAAAIGRALVVVLVLALALSPVAAGGLLVAWLLRRRQRRIRHPSGEAQRRLVRAARRAGVVVGPADTNPVIGALVAAARPEVADAAARAARLVDAATFGGLDADVAEQAVRELDTALR